MKPDRVPRKLLDSPDHRQMARRMRDGQWAFAERVAARGTLWVCWWNKNRHHQPPHPDDLEICGLIDGMELLEWLGSHPSWWAVGPRSEARYAAPVSITAAGRQALQNRSLYDREPVTGGLVEPGWQAVPADREMPDA